MNQKQQTGLVVIFLIFLGFLTKPILAIPGGQIFSVPSLLVYFLLAWISLIVLIRLVFGSGISSKKSDTETK